MYSISICDANKKSRDSLERILNCYFKAKDILVRIRKFEKISDMIRLGWVTDIVFLDEETLGTEKHDFPESLVRCNPKAHLYILGESYCYRDYAKELHVFRYLEKPVDLDRLYLSLNIILDMQKEISFTSDYLSVTLKEDEIVCIYSFNRKTYVLTDTGVSYPTNITIKEWKNKVKGLETFTHPHYSYIVNQRYISSFNGKIIVLRCMDGKTVSVTPSQRRLGEFRNDFYRRIRSV